MGDSHVPAPVGVCATAADERGEVTEGPPPDQVAARNSPPPCVIFTTSVYLEAFSGHTRTAAWASFVVSRAIGLSSESSRARSRSRTPLPPRATTVVHCAPRSRGRRV